jgi:RNA polymerase sigma-70 factor (ECF subfamily)
MADLDAAELVQAALRQDDQAARELVRRLYPLVAKMVRSHRPRRTSEEDLCQMIFIKVFQKLDQFSGKVPIEHWVSRIAVNTCLSQIESEKVRPELRHADLSEEEQAVVANLAVSNEELAPDRQFASRQLVEHLLEMLKPAERLVIDLLYLQGRSVEEIHQITGLGAAAIKVRAFRARQKMKAQLNKLSAKKSYEGY